MDFDAALDLSYAYEQGMVLPAVSAQVARLAYADLSFAQVMESDFGGATMTGLRMRKAFLRDVRFASVPGAEIKPPFGKEIDFYNTQLAGADFSGATVLRSDFDNVDALAIQFDDATLVEVDFSGAQLSAGTFRGAVLLDVRFDGADLRSVDFDGAIMVGADALARITAEAAAGTFRAERFEVTTIAPEEALSVVSLYSVMGIEALEAHLGGRALVRVTRVAPFEN